MCSSVCRLVNLYCTTGSSRDSLGAIREPPSLVLGRAKVGVQVASDTLSSLSLGPSGPVAHRGLGESESQSTFFLESRTRGSHFSEKRRSYRLRTRKGGVRPTHSEGPALQHDLQKFCLSGMSQGTRSRG